MAIETLPTEPLPIDRFLPAIIDALASARAVVVTAAPGAGKTTRVPPALVAAGPVIVLEPRRVAARAIAHRIAAERGWTLGREVGWHVRFERMFGPETALIIATEGILTSRLQQDPSLTAFRTVVLDEFHERSVHGDVALALTRRAWRDRPDLRIVVMSATLDAARVSLFLDDCPIVQVPGRVFPLDVQYRPGLTIDEAIAAVLPHVPRAALAFLAGAAEIRRAADRLQGAAAAAGVAIVPLHGGLDADEQDRAVRPATNRRVVLATNIAETSLTVPDVSVVVDTGAHKVSRYDAERGIDSLALERVSMDSADQRAGRAGRTGPGLVWRLWDARDRLRPHREPEIARIDLAAVCLDVLAWGGDPRTVEWFDAPPRSAVDSAAELLIRLHAVDDRAGRLELTPMGRRLQRFPLHPRLSRILIEARGATVAARACALLSERHVVPPRHGATICDVLSAVDRDASLPPHVHHTAGRIRDIARSVLGDEARDQIAESAFTRAVLAGYPDRVARRRAARSDRLLMASGTGARLARESGVHDAEFLVAVDVAGRAPGSGGEALVRLATSISRDWLTPTGSEHRHVLDDATGVVRAARVDLYGAIVLSEHPTAPDPVVAGALIADAIVRRGPADDDTQLLNRLAFAGAAVPFETLVRRAAARATRTDAVRIADHLTAGEQQALSSGAPTTVKLSNGVQLTLDYRDEGRAIASAKIQTLFGVTETPRIGPRRVPVTFELLAPNGRPVQVTNDLAGFWKRGYLDVRAQLKARYPKHRWD